MATLGSIAAEVKRKKFTRKMSSDTWPARSHRGKLGKDRASMDRTQDLCWMAVVGGFSSGRDIAGTGGNDE
jgi:hypothetical protein